MNSFRRKYFFVLMSVVLVLTSLGLILPEKSEAAGDDRVEIINKLSKKSRYKFIMTDGISQYNIFIYSDKEKKNINDMSWACANEGAVYYSGNYNVAVIKKGSTIVKTTKIGEQTFNNNPSYNFAYLVKGKPDLIAIATCEASVGASVEIFSIVKDKMAKFKNGVGTNNGVNIKAAGNQTFQSAYFSNAEDWGYFFQTWTIDKTKLTINFKKTFHSANGSENVYKKWLKDPKYIVTK